jgi:hypothetical protein
MVCVCAEESLKHSIRTVLVETSRDILIFARQRLAGRTIVFLRLLGGISSFFRLLDSRCLVKRQAKTFQVFLLRSLPELYCVHTFETNGHQFLSNSSSGISNGVPTLNRRARFSSRVKFKQGVFGRVAVEAIIVFVNWRGRFVGGSIIDVQSPVKSFLKKTIIKACVKKA